MRFSKMLMGLALPVVVAGCSTLTGATGQRQDLSKADQGATPFTQALAKEYDAFARSSRLQADPSAADHFAGKGKAAAQGATVVPEDPSAWSITDRRGEQDLAAGRERLMAALANSAPHRVPMLSATAQVKYDCWVAQERQPHRAGEVTPCHRDFMAAMDAIDEQARMGALMDASSLAAGGRLPGGTVATASHEGRASAASASNSTPAAASSAALPPSPSAPAASPVTAATQVPAVAPGSLTVASAATPVAVAGHVSSAGKPGSYQVFFDFNRSRLSREASPMITSVAAAARAAGYPKLVVIGYTDLTGSRSYNKRLSLRRAEAVRRQLIAAGVPSSRVTVEGRGRADPLVSTADGVREPQNRRVVVQFQAG
ncbi:MAG: OmpA family protein [Telmatospirillum sp.]|nr:OmpA family protein [Telmatospirillum sp.]